jgi:regulator of RNase E activity RraA
VRDIDDLAPEFGVLCAEVVPSHGWVRPVGFGEGVEVFQMAVSSGDLVHADRHGAVVIPQEVAAEVARAALLSHENEAPILAAARGSEFTVAALEAVTSAQNGMH